MSTTNKRTRRGAFKVKAMRIVPLAVWASVLTLGAGAVSAQGYNMQEVQNQLGAAAQSQSQSAPGGSQAQAAFGMSNVDASESAVLRPGDTINVQVFNTPELSGTLRIDRSGNITLPIGTSIHVEGMSAVEASKAIEKTLRDQQIMYAPLVNVLVSGYALETVTITGEIKGPGIYPLRGSRRLSDALALAGWLNITTGSTISVAHRGDYDNPFVINTADPKFNVIAEQTMLQSGDTVRVAKADLIYVIGDVKMPGVYPMPNGQRFTILTVLALSGGTTLTSKSAHAAIIRPTATGADTIPVNLDLISKNQAPNITLEPKDVLVIPHSGWKTFEQYALPGLTTSVTSAAGAFLYVR
jgi:polysaccharide export outer membrane protein